jgi:hypothetical protein
MCITLNNKISFMHICVKRKKKLLVKRFVSSGLLMGIREINFVDNGTYLSAHRSSLKYTLNLEAMADTEKRDI